MRFGWVGFNAISTIVGYLMPNSLYTYIYIKYMRFGWVGFNGISTIVGYLMPHSLYTYIYIKYMTCQHEVNRYNFKQAWTHI